MLVSSRALSEEVQQIADRVGSLTRAGWSVTGGSTSSPAVRVRRRPYGDPRIGHRGSSTALDEAGKAGWDG